MNSFRHSGKLGDIIYSLPTVKALGGGIFYVDARTQYLAKPPLGIDAANKMIELLSTQPYIQKAELFAQQPLTIDLDRFRHTAIPVHVFNSINAESGRIADFLFGDLARDLRRKFVPTIDIDLVQFHWEAANLQGRADPNQPWITGLSPKPLAEIVICRTGRYSGDFDWSRVKSYADRAVFLGFESEWQAFRAAHFDVSFYQVSSLLDFAQVIAGAKLYVGNQSFGLALANSMVIPSIVELCGPNPLPVSAANVHRNLEHRIVEGYLNS
jgi:hypothetical protein